MGYKGLFEAFANKGFHKKVVVLKTHRVKTPVFQEKSKPSYNRGLETTVYF